MKAVLFDLDGTLIDTEKYYAKCWPEALKAFGYEMTREQVLSIRSLGRPFAPIQFKNWYGDAFDYNAVRTKRKELVDAMVAAEGVSPKEGAQEILKELKENGVQYAVVTASEKERAERYLEKAGLLQDIPMIISATQVQAGKPAPDVYLYACEQLGLAPKDCLAVEDAPNGIISAYLAGCKIVMAVDQTEPSEREWKLIKGSVNSLMELKKYI